MIFYNKLYGNAGININQNMLSSFCSSCVTAKDPKKIICLSFVFSKNCTLIINLGNCKNLENNVEITVFVMYVPDFVIQAK